MFKNEKISIFLKRFQLGLTHTAVAMTLIPFTSTLNRVMISELGISKTLFMLLAIFPSLLSSLQVTVGSFSYRRPVVFNIDAPMLFMAAEG